MYSENSRRGVNTFTDRYIEIKFMAGLVLDLWTLEYVTLMSHAYELVGLDYSILQSRSQLNAARQLMRELMTNALNAHVTPALSGRLASKVTDRISSSPGMRNTALNLLEYFGSRISPRDPHSVTKQVSLIFEAAGATNLSTVQLLDDPVRWKHAARLGFRPPIRRQNEILAAIIKTDLATLGTQYTDQQIQSVAVKTVRWFRLYTEAT